MPRDGSIAGMCICCQKSREGGRGDLCRKCSAQAVPHEGLIAEHIWSTVTDAAAWLVDGFGRGHEIGERTQIGRHHEGALVVLSNSVSREQGELRRSQGVWSIRVVHGTPCRLVELPLNVDREDRTRP
jgi:hypothetical protein